MSLQKRYHTKNPDTIYEVLRGLGYVEEKSMYGCSGCCAWQADGNPGNRMPYERKICRFIAGECENRRTVLVNSRPYNLTEADKIVEDTEKAAESIKRLHY